MKTLGLAAAAWVVDLNVCRARLRRCGRANWRPRAWLLAAGIWGVRRLEAGGWMMPPERYFPVVWTIFLAACVLAAVMVPDDPAEAGLPPVPWWAVWRHGTGSAPAFVLVWVAVTMGALVRATPWRAAPYLLGCLDDLEVAALVAIGLVSVVATVVRHRGWAVAVCLLGFTLWHGIVAAYDAFRCSAWEFLYLPLAALSPYWALADSCHYWLEGQTTDPSLRLLILGASVLVLGAVHRYLREQAGQARVQF